MNIDLYVNYYNSPLEKRQEEIQKCIGDNIENPYIDMVYIIVKELDEYVKKLSINSKNVRVIHTDKYSSLSYYDFIEICNKYSNDNSICIFANSDIIFDDTVNKIKTIIKDKDFLCISRQELGPNNIWREINNPHHSQDAWCIKHSSLKYLDDNLLHEIKNIQLGTPRCDMKITAVFFIHNWNVANICRFVNIKHIHFSKVSRNYSVFNTDNIGLNAEVFPINSPNEKSKINLLCQSIRTDSSDINIYYTNWIGSQINASIQVDKLNTYKVYNQIYIKNNNTLEIDITNLHCIETNSNSYFHIIIDQTKQKLIICPGRNIHFIMPHHSNITLRILTDADTDNCALLVSHFHHKPQI